MLITLPFLGATTEQSTRLSLDSSPVSSQPAQTPDFSISATSPQPVNVNQSTISTIVINTLNSFAGFVAIDDALPDGLTCDSIAPPVVHESGIAIVSCSATMAGQYDLNVTGTSGSLSHATTATFDFVDFKIRAVAMIGAPITPLSSTISIEAVNGFSGDVAVTAMAQSGLACGSITPTDIIGSGTATVSCTASSTGIYILTVSGTSGSLTHSASATFKIVNLPDFSIIASDPAPVDAGQQATSTITIKELNGFADIITFTDEIPSDLTCQMIMPAGVAGSIASTVVCSSNKAATYKLIVTATSNSLSHSTMATFNFVDFTITSSSPSTSAIGLRTESNIIIGSLNGFVGTVSLTYAAPTGLNCGAISLDHVLGSGMATISCSATSTGIYVLAVDAASGLLTHSVNVTFTFAAVLPDFSITAATSVTFTSGSAGTSTISISGLNGFHGSVSLSEQISPSSGLMVTLDPASHYPGVSTATFSSSSPGDYTVTMTGTSGSLSHSTTITVTVTPVSALDFGLSASSSIISIEAGSTGTDTITITPYNGFTGTTTLAVTTPTSVSCSLSPTSVVSLGASTLTCGAGRAGNYEVTITAANGANSHTTTVEVRCCCLAVPTPTARDCWTSHRRHLCDRRIDNRRCRDWSDSRTTKIKTLLIPIYVSPTLSSEVRRTLKREKSKQPHGQTG